MSIQPKKTTVDDGIVVFKEILETASGGFRLDTTGLVADSYVPKGSPIGFNEATRVATVQITAELHTDATNTATTYQVKKGHLFAVDKYLAQVAGGKAYAITAIDTSNANYDVLTVGTTLGVALVAGDVLFESSATGATAAAYKTTVKGLLHFDTKVEAGAEVSAVIRGTVLARRAPRCNATIKALIPTIIFSESY